ncbi:MAG TPA: hypothetical protein VK139_06145 [Microbacteriaceae bacterium]|nr:hypothetical protein [Microbacteriaceae bacterium]
MEILFVFIIGASFGAIARYSLPRRDRTGAILAPALGAAIASASWTMLTWAGLKWDAAIIWWVVLGMSQVGSFVALFLLGRSRQRRDEQRFSQLSGGASL